MALFGNVFENVVAKTTISRFATFLNIDEQWAWVHFHGLCFGKLFPILLLGLFPQGGNEINRFCHHLQLRLNTEML